MQSFWTLILLSISNVFMTFAWYGHLKLKTYPQWAHLPLWGLVLLSWGLAFFEYCFQVPANRIGFQGNGGPFSLIQLKVLQEVLSLVIFTLVASFMFQGEKLRWNHLVAFLFLILAVYFAFRKTD